MRTSLQPGAIGRPPARFKLQCYPDPVVQRLILKEDRDDGYITVGARF